MAAASLIDKHATTAVVCLYIYFIHATVIMLLLNTLITK